MRTVIDHLQAAEASMTFRYLRSLARPLFLAAVLLALPITFSGPMTDTLPLPSVKPSDACGETGCCVLEPGSICLFKGQQNYNEYSDPEHCNPQSAQVP